ncbi:MAG: phage Gp37/Gp68 family protein [Bacillota bacterium]
MAKTKIEWTEYSWNPVTGCTKISPGCANCYAERFAHRLAGRFGYPPDKPFKVTIRPDRLKEPLRWKKSRTVFVSSRGDLFHEDVPSTFIADIFDTIQKAKQHTFLILTKRPERMRFFLQKNGPIFGKEPLPNVWLGVSVENQQYADERIPILLQIPAAVRFISVEPMLSSVDLRSYLWPEFSQEVKTWPDDNRARIGWIIAGGETGPDARPVHPNWVRSIRNQAVVAGVPFFFKSWREWQLFKLAEPLDVRNKKTGDFETWPVGKEVFKRVGRKTAGCLLDGRIWNDYPNQRE